MGEFKIVGNIDLSKFEKRGPKVNFEKVSSFLKNNLIKISKDINNEYKYLGTLLEDDLTIKIDGPNSDLHKKIVQSKEEAWAAEKSCSISTWRDKKEKDPSSVAEMLITTLLHNALKDRFLVARASYYDDYENGVDYVVLDKETGALVCGFDQVLGMGKDDGSAKKREKIEKINLKGGARLEHGITFSNDKKIIKKNLKNIPAFFLAISKNDLDKIALLIQEKGLSDDFSELNKNQEFASFSNQILKNMIDSLDEQSSYCNDSIKNKENTSSYYNLLKNIENFKSSLDVIRHKIAN